MFLAGDAVHLVIPTGGLGMNSGVGDAIDLSWKLAATLAGWGGPELLKSYEIERRQIGDRNVGASRYATIGRRKWRSMWRPDITEDSPAGAVTRQESHRCRRCRAAQEQRDDRRRARLSLRRLACHLQHTGRPGAPVPRIPADHLARRTAAACLARRRHGNAGPRWRRLHGSANSAAPRRTSAASNARCVRTARRLSVLDIPDRAARDIYGYDLILVRPDLHVVWRGNAAPEDPERVAAVATGHSVDIWLRLRLANSAACILRQRGVSGL